MELTMNTLNTPRQRRNALQAAVCLALLANASTLFAQSAASIEEILVLDSSRAYRGNFSLMETPAADLIIDARTLKDAGALDLNQALDLSSSVARQNNFGGLWNSFAIRGFVGDENLPSNYLVNGFNAGRGFAGPRDMSGIESVEVLKGPRAALFGRGEPGGSVNLVTKRPHEGNDGELNLSTARFDTRRGDIDWNQQVNDTVAYRVVGYAQDAGSFRNTVESKSHGLFPSLALQLGADTRLVYELEYSEQESPFDRGVVAPAGKLDGMPRSNFLGEPGDGPMTAEALGHQLELVHQLTSEWTLLAGYNQRDTSLAGFSTEPELTGARQALPRDGRTLTRQRRSRSYDADYSILRAELNGDIELGSLRHRLIIGADSDSFENDQVFRRARAPTLASNPTLAQLQAIDILAPVYGQYPLPTPTLLTDRLETQEADGLYFQDQISLNAQWELRLGGRFDRFEQDQLNRANNSRSKQSDERFSPQLGLVFAATEQLSFFGVYGESFRALSGSDFAGNNFDPNTSSAVEAGMKFQLNEGRLTGNVSIYSIEQDNILASDPVNAGFLVAAGEAESQGFEIDLGGEVLPGLQVWFSYSYTDASVVDDLLDPNFGLVVRGGDRMLNVPSHAMSAMLVKETTLASRPLRIGGSLTHVGERLGEAATNFELPDYTLTRVFADYSVNSTLTLRAEIDNLFDETWYSNSFSSLWVQPGMPRSYRFSANIRF
jgi:iron complex outermembrane receptor protein